MRYGNRYYRGSNRYVYYRNGVPQYYYSDRPFTLRAAIWEKISKIFWNIVSVIMGVLVAFSGIKSVPHKVKTDYNTEIVINDSAQLLSETETAEMNTGFLAFQEKTGVTPAFFTIFDTDLEKQGGKLHEIAYRLYVNTFDDEKHWLVVYCLDDAGEYWSWEGMIGDDCESIISTDLENEFTKKLQNNLENNPRMISASVINAFETIGSKSGKIPIGKIFWLVFAIAGGAYFVYMAVRSMISLINRKAAEDPRINSEQCPTAETEPETAKCQYCGGEFVAGLHTACPHCGAPIEKWE